MKRKVFFALSLIFLAVSPARAASFTGTCMRVADGDTCTVETEDGRKERVRIHGIDAPELGQPYGQAAKKALQTLLLSKTVRVEYTGRDKYARIVGRILLDTEDAGVHMVEIGLAWHYEKFAPKAIDIRTAEENARLARAGLWHDKNPVPPWEYRRLHRSR